MHIHYFLVEEVRVGRSGCGYFGQMLIDLVAAALLNFAEVLVEMAPLEIIVLAVNQRAHLQAGWQVYGSFAAYPNLLGSIGGLENPDGGHFRGRYVLVSDHIQQKLSLEHVVVVDRGCIAVLHAQYLFEADLSFSNRVGVAKILNGGDFLEIESDGLLEHLHAEVEVLLLPLFQVELVLLTPRAHPDAVVDFEVYAFGNVLKSFELLPEFVELVVALLR